jgi:hypothetical protein
MLKSRVNGEKNLSTIIELQQCLAFAEKFHFTTPSVPNPIREFRAPQYPNDFAFFYLRNKHYQLTETELKSLQGYYRAKYDIPMGANHEFKEMKRTIQLWHAFRNGDITFRCERARRQDSTRLNHLAHLVTLEDANKHVRDGVRERNFQPLEEYAYIQFFAVHQFQNETNMLLYNFYRKIEVVEGLVRDMGFRNRGWADVETLKHLCAKVNGKDGWVYFVDDPEKIVERLRKSLHIY